MKKFLLINKQKLNDIVENFHNIITNEKYNNIQLFLKNFIINKYFCIKFITNLKFFFSQYNFLQHLIIIYKQNYNI